MIHNGANQMILMDHKILIDGLILTGWGLPEVYNFIEDNPNIWLQAMTFDRLLDAVGHIEMFVATDPKLREEILEISCSSCGFRFYGDETSQLVYLGTEYPFCPECAALEADQQRNNEQKAEGQNNST
jgi:hypothetical protein